MVLRFEVNQAEAFRKGVNVPKSTNHLDVDPAKLSQEERDLIADRLDGIDVCKMEAGGKLVGGNFQPTGAAQRSNSRVVAKLPTFEALMDAIRENQTEVDRELNLQKNEVDSVLKPKRKKPYVNAAEILAEKERTL
jgi:hypothetical protein